MPLQWIKHELVQPPAESDPLAELLAKPTHPRDKEPEQVVASQVSTAQYVVYHPQRTPRRLCTCGNPRCPYGDLSSGYPFGYQEIDE